MPNDDAKSSAPAVSALTSGQDKVPAQNQLVEQVQQQEPAPVDASNQVQVQPIRSFTDSATGQFVTPASKPYSVTRQRAAELFAGGLIEYVDESDEDAMIADQTQAATEAVKAQANSRRSKSKA